MTHPRLDIETPTTKTAWLSTDGHYRVMIAKNKCPPRRVNGRGTGQHPVEVLTMANGTCSIDGCEKRHYARGWCSTHYDRWRRHGDPSRTTVIVGDDERRFWTKVDKFGPDGFHSQTGENLGPCWRWTAGCTRAGYGLFSINRHPTYAHRFAYEVTVGRIPPRLQIDHLCRIKNCVNPVHLEPVTNAENGRRGLAGHHWATRTSCLKGHPYTVANLYVDPSGRRRCVTCRRSLAALYREKKRVGQ